MKLLAPALAIAVTLTALPGGALACTMVRPDPPPTQARIDAWTRQRFAQAGAAVEVEAVRGSNGGAAGQMRVVRAYKGNIAAGALLTVRVVSTAMCGVGDFAQGSRGLLLIPTRGPIIFQGYLTASEVALLRRSGLLSQRRR